ncbi:hypothetical protein JCM15519_22410 [Fundidesulfovibrio butyratiphilus]
MPFQQSADTQTMDLTSWLESLKHQQQYLASLKNENGEIIPMTPPLLILAPTLQKKYPDLFTQEAFNKSFDYFAPRWGLDKASLGLTTSNEYPGGTDRAPK